MTASMILIVLSSFFVFFLVFLLMYFSLQSLDFSKLFKPNSAKQINIIVCLLSAVVGIVISFGIGELLTIIIVK